ncbi:sigma-54 dependent transcriptional regulator [Geomonas sp. Red69]|uniref:sigma-54-dependent transcriptional regulator n=1 Tax=Geomonas diazotrophica TaxID=2843197 RepID=UPI001C114230|nr:MULTISPECIES: sigma-54 dependent transcriptional regulator [Geomonas]MBU5635795.1 sigma-54 dependent transcriptional regulator [Geomonas diazotrophica]QXE87103.1 sigma-54 dependent transcriptional regulator [Geomonas nitrogeniifigens]
MTESRVLLVDDDPISLAIIEKQLASQGMSALTAASGQEGLALLAKEKVALVISDLVMPEMDGIAFMHAARERFPSLTFIMLTAAGSIESAVAAMKEGAFDYLEKPCKGDAFQLAIRRALEFGRLSGQNAQLLEHFQEKFSFQNIVTQSPVFRRVLEVAGKAAASPRTTICLTGESGTGKEVLAKAIHCTSGALPGTFVAVNCAAIPEALLESELFGHVRGAFTGADRDREGKFSLAQGGTVLLDEIGDMPPSLQAKLLRVLEERSFEKIGSNKAIPADFRIIAATHRDLAEMVRKGEFREDLYHRINVVPLIIPPLRERREDIPLLVDFFINLFRQHQGKALPGVSRKALGVMMEYSWPGNIRELRNVLEYATILVSNELIRPEHLRLAGSDAQSRPDPGVMVEYHLQLPPDELSLRAITDRVLTLTLERCGGNKSRAAELLKVNRKMFYS